ncbi:HSP20-like chaperone [Cubamyces lactineus]|nr:HSP20-like chaperone [Cubamyces lactineus]
MSPQYTFKSAVPSTRSSSKSRTMSQEEDPRFRHLDRMLARAYIELQRQRHQRKNTTMFMPRMDLCDDPNSPFIVALFELPGMKADQLSVRIENGKLIVDGERTGPHLHGNGNEPSNAASEPMPSATLYPVQEIKYGKFRRELALPAGVTAAHVRSTLAEGMLTVSWPRNPTPPPAHPTPTSGQFYAADLAAAQTNTGHSGGEAAVA